MFDHVGQRARRQQHAGIADRKNGAGPEAKPFRRYLFGGERHRTHEHAGGRNADQELREHEARDAGRKPARHRAYDRSKKQGERDRAHAEPVDRGADRDLQRREREMINRDQARQRLRCGRKVPGHQVEADAGQRSQAGRQGVAAGQRQQGKEQRAGMGWVGWAGWGHVSLLFRYFFFSDLGPSCLLD